MSINKPNLPDLGRTLDLSERFLRLAPFFPPHVIRSVLRRAEPAVRGYLQFIDGTLLVTDLRGFSAQSATLFDTNKEDDRALSTFVNAYFQAVLPVMRRFGGSPCFFDGDALSGLFYGRYHAATAVAAACAIRAEVTDTSVNLPIGAVGLQISQGLSSGLFLSTSLGRDDARIWSLFGSAGTQAVAAQKLAHGTGIVLADSTLARLDPTPICRPVAHGFAMLDVEVSPAASLKRRGLGWVRAPRKAAQTVTFLEAHFPPPITQQLISGTVPLRRCPVAVLFVNIDGIGRKVEAHGATVVMDLNTLFEGIRQIVDRRGGLLNKVNPYRVGDKYLVFFGLSELPCPHPERAALDAALELQGWVSGLSGYRQRIGLSVGQATECVVGDDWRREFTMMGRPVNEAVHLMELAGWGEIVAANERWLDTPPRGWTMCSEQIVLKGNDEPVQIARFVQLPATCSSRTTTYQGRDLVTDQSSLI